MEEHWMNFKALGKQLEEHNFKLDSISPPHQPVSYESSPPRGKSRLSDVSLAEHRLIDLSRDIRERDKQIAGLMRDVAGLESYKAQCLNLKAQVQLLTEKNRLLLEERKQLHTPDDEAVHADLLSEVQDLRQTLKQKEARALELKLALESKERLCDIALQTKQDLERNLEAVQAGTNGQQEQLVTCTQVLREKEVLIETLEEDNAKLRGELQKALEGLQQCQTELKFMGKLRMEVQQSAQLLTSVELQFEHEQANNTALLRDCEELKGALDLLRHKCQDKDPEAYIDLLQRQHEEVQQLISKAQEDQKLLEQKQMDLERRLTATRRGLKTYFEKLRGWLEAFSMDTASPLPTLVLPDSFKDVGKYVQACHDVLESMRGETGRRMSELEAINGQLSERNEFFEQSSEQLRTKIEALARQVEDQETLSKQLLTEKETAERRFHEKFQRYKASKRALKSELATWRSEYQTFVDGSRLVLQEAGKFGVPHQSSIEAKLYLSDVCNCLNLLSSKLGQALEEKEGLQLDLDSALLRAEEEASNLAECSQEYMTRVQELNSKITALTKTVSEASKGSEDFARKYQFTLDQCEELERERDGAVASVESMEAQVHSYAGRVEQTTGLLSATLAALYQLKEDYMCAKQVARVWAADIDASRRLLAKYAGKRLPVKHPMLKFRSCVIAVLAHNRLLKLQKKPTYLSFCGIPIPAADYGSSLQEFLSEAAAKQPRFKRESAAWRLGAALTRAMQILGLREYGVTVGYLASVMEEHVQKLTAVAEAKVKE